MNKQKIFIDTDMGVDDLMAICMFLSSERFETIGISVVNGVARANTGVRNLARVLYYMRMADIPIIRGFAKPISKSWRVEFPIIDRQRANRLTLVQNINLPKFISKDIRISGAVDSIFRKINKSPEKVILICLGPLTNVATEISKYGDRFTNKLERIVLMGGAVDVPGIVSPNNFAEYNMYLDPEAAKVVFDSGIPITMVPIDATKWVPADPKKARNDLERKALAKFYQVVRRSRPSKKTGKIIKEIILNNKGDFNFFYDPLVSSILEKPNIVEKFKKLKIRVLLTGQKRGATRGEDYGRINVSVINKVNSDEFYRLVRSKLL